MAMTLKECYESIQGDYDGLVARVLSESRAEHFALMFLKDPSYQQLCDAMGGQDYNAAFAAAHTLKGLCLNLGFGVLYEPVAALTEQLRGGKKPQDKTLLEQAAAAYEHTCSALCAYQADSRG